MRILLTGTSASRDYGGPAVSVPRLAHALAGLDVQAALWFSDGSRPAEELAARANVKLLNGSMRDALESFRPDVVHDNGVWLPHHHFLARLCTASRIPRVVSPRGMLEPWSLSDKKLKKRVAWTLYQRRDLSHAQLIHATSKEEAENIQRLLPGRPVSVVPNGVDLPAPARATAASRASEPGATRTALFLSRLHPKKGLDMLIEAWSRVSPAGWKLLIAGPGDPEYVALLHKLVRERTAGDGSIEIRNAVYGEEKAALFRGANLFVLPSFSENFGIAIAEALAHGLPVITTRETPWSALRDHSCGWWIDATLPALVESLAHATRIDAATLNEMGARGTRLVEREFGWDVLAGTLLAQYAELKRAVRSS